MIVHACLLHRIRILGKEDDGLWKIVHEDLIRACTGDDEQLLEWTTLLRHNGIKTSQNWLLVRNSSSYHRDTFGAMLVVCLDKLAGTVTLPAAAVAEVFDLAGELEHRHIVLRSS